MNGQTVSIAIGSSNTGPSGYYIYSSVNGYSASLGTLSTNCPTGQVANTITLPATEFNGLSSITFRIVGIQSACGASSTFGSAGTGGPSSIIINGTTSLQTDFYVDDNSNAGDVYTPLATGNDANPGTIDAPFATISHAITVAQAGNTIWVDAGTYREDITVDKSLTIKGANYCATPNAGPRASAESIIQPLTNDPVNNTFVYLNGSASNTIIDGFTLDGDNTAVGGGVSMNGADVNAAEAVGAYDGLSNVTISNNIIKNLNYSGIDFYNYYNGGAATSGNSITNNRFENILPSSYGIGVLIYNNCYTSITNNVMTGVRVGIQTGNFYLANPGSSGYQNIANNTISTIRRGIFHNLFYSSASPYTISNNIITGIDNANETLWDGMLISSMQATASTVIGNTVNGSAVSTQATTGISVWNCQVAPLISGGTITGTQLGINVNNYEGYNNSNAGTTSATIDGVNITGSSIAGIKVHDNPQNSNGATVTAEIKNVTLSNSGSGTGIWIAGSDASADIHDNAATITGFVIAVDVDGGTAALNKNNITANGTGIRVQNGGNLSSVTENFISNNTVDGIRVESTAGTIGEIHKNDLSGNSNKAINNLSSSSLNATCNWYGSTVLSTVAGMISGNVSSTPYLTSGTDSQPGTAGFQTSEVCSTCSLGVTTSSTQATCPLQNNGTATANVTGAVGAVTYSWNTTPVQTTATATGLTAGDYTITVTDVNGCIATANVTVTNDPSGPVHNINTGLNYCTIQAAINDPLTLNGHVVSIDAGTYAEDVVVTKELEIKGAGASTIIMPATSNSNTGGGSLGGTNVFLIQANNVKIHDLTIDGDNPSLTSAENVGGANIDARNGIITNHNLGVYTNLEVYNTNVKNIFLRGIYQSSGGTFNFHDNTVTNVQADPASIAMFAFGSSGEFDHNTVSYSNDAISANWSTGITFSNNTVTNSGSGVHTDNSGTSGTVVDEIYGNTVSNSATGGYGIWVFVPYKNVLVHDNKVTNVDVGMAVAGQGATDVTPEFYNNEIDGQNKANSTGVYVTTTEFGWGSSNVSVDFHNNIVTNNAGDGFYLESEAGYTLTINAHENSITNNSPYAVEKANTGTFNADMSCNWWGSTTSSTIASSISGTGVTYIPYLTNGTDESSATGFQTSETCSACTLNVTTSVTDITCHSANDGTATANVTGAYTINWTTNSSNGFTSSDEDPNVTSSATLSDAGTYTINVSDANGCSTSGNVVVTINKRNTSLIYTGASSVQYSDSVALSAQLKDVSGASPSVSLAGRTIKFTIGTQSTTATTDASGIAKTWMTIYQAPGSATTVTTSFDGSSDALLNSSSDSDPFTINQEDARIYYTGALFASTSGATSTSATVTLSATVRDITSELADAAHDIYPGDIRKAKVYFKIIETGNIYGPFTPGLVNPNDTTTGTVTQNVILDIGSADSKQFTVSMWVDGNYTRNSSADNTIVTVSKPLNDFITGGGYVLLNSSAGLKAGDAGTKNNFGFNVKWNKSNKNLQGNINTIVRKTESDGLHVYQIKGNSMTSLSVNPPITGPIPGPGTATFNGKASIQDITDPNNPISVEGNASLQVTMSDYGEPGNLDRIAITVWNKSGGLWFANNWDGTKTEEQKLDGGNLKVSSSNSTVGAQTSTTKLVSNSNPSIVGQSVTFTATVTGFGKNKPTGYVRFIDMSSNQTLTTVSLNSTGMVSFTTSALTAGQHDIYAYYGGDSKFDLSAADLIQTVNVASIKRQDVVTEQTEEVSGITVKVYPNPTEQEFSMIVSGNSKEKVNVRIFDITGKLIKSINGSVGQVIHFGENMSGGTYVAEVIQGMQRKTIKLIKQ
jgi:hypothetical protein